jgi:hypothetical protein
MPLGYVKIKYKISTLLKSSPLSFFSAKKVIRKMENMPDFPSSACTSRQYLDLTLSGATTTYELLSKATQAEELKIKTLEDFVSGLENDLTNTLGALLNKYGSDKAQHHNYHKIYGDILKPYVGKSARILEIGLGTNNTDTPSNMGRKGRPGASLRAWKDLDSKFQVVGADIDHRVLFNEDRIQTYQLDQTSEISWSEFVNKLGSDKFNVIIDDGLHSPTANLNSILYLLPLLETNGVLVVEDIAERALPVWGLFTNLMPDHWSTQMIRTKRSYVLLLKKLN